MKFVVAILVVINFLFGVKNLLNVFNVLQDSKFGQGSTAAFAFICLAMAVGGFWFGFIKASGRLALIVSVGPWLLAVLLAFASMVTSDYK